MSGNFGSLRLLPRSEWVIVVKEYQTLCVANGHFPRISYKIKNDFANESFWIEYVVRIVFSYFSE